MSQQGRIHTHTGPLPIDPAKLRAWSQIIQYLDNYLQEAPRILQYLSGAKDDPENYVELLHGTLPYMVNTLYIAGGRGSGKSTHLTTLFYLYRHALLHPHERPPCCPNAEVPRPIHIAVDILDPSVIPDDDHIVAWIAQAFNKLIAKLEELNTRYRAASFDEMDRLRESYSEFERSLYLLPVNHTELLKIIVTELDDYIESSRSALNSGYSLARNYVLFSYQLRKVVGKLLSHLRVETRTEHKSVDPANRLILIGFDDIDMAPRRLIEIIVLCRLLSLDPYTLCVLSLRRMNMIYISLEEYIKRKIYNYMQPCIVKLGYSDTMECIDTGTDARQQIAHYVVPNIQSKLFVPTEENVILLRPWSPRDVLQYIPPAETEIRDSTEKPKPLKEILQKSEIAEKIVYRKVIDKREELAYTIYTRKLLRYPRCIDGFYKVVERYRKADSDSFVEMLARSLALCGMDAKTQELRDLIEQVRDGASFLLKTVTQLSLPLRAIGSTMIEIAEPNSIYVVVEKPFKIETREALAAAAMAELYYYSGRLVARLEPSPHIAFSTARHGRVELLAPPLYRPDAQVLLAELLSRYFSASTVAETQEPYHGETEYTVRLLLAYPLLAYAIHLEDKKILSIAMETLTKPIDNVGNIIGFINSSLRLEPTAASYGIEIVSRTQTVDAKRVVEMGIADTILDSLLNIRELLENIASAAQQAQAAESVVKQREAMELELWIQRYISFLLNEERVEIPWHTRVVVAALLDAMLKGPKWAGAEGAR